MRLTGVMPETSGSPAFDQLRDALRNQPRLRSELESALDLNVHRVNPTDRANRFGSGGAVEWILAATAYSAGVLAVPGGHNADGFDLRDVREGARGLWSIKNTTKRSDFRLTNGLGGAGAGFTDPVIFLSPALPGLTYIDPERHRIAASQVREMRDAAVLPFRAVQQHTVDHPECVAECAMPSNPGTGQADPWMDYVESLLHPELFPRLSALFADARPPVANFAGELRALIDLRDRGEITPEQFDRLIDRFGAP